jgi:N-acetylmuramoyl-L-alanine amidase
VNSVSHLTQLIIANALSRRRLCILLCLALAGLIAASPEEKRISIYSTAANYALPVSDHGGKDYVGLLEILEPLGTVSAKTSDGHWKLTYNDAQCEFTSEKKRARVRGKDFDLTANFLFENGRGLVPLSSLATLLPRILGGPVSFNEAARRLFVGNVAVHFTAQVAGGNPPKLVMNFTAPVNPTIATEPGKLQMTFSHEGVVSPGSQLLTFGSSAIPSASFQEKNGAAELDVNSNLPLMATFSNGSRTITVAPPAAPVASTSVNPQAPVPSPAPAASVMPSPPIAPVPAATIPVAPHYFAVIDASHGGDERGAALTDQIAEKDVTLAIARSLRQELTARGLSTMMVRDADVTLNADQRASMANATGAAIYICIHASSEGRGVRVYTALLPPARESNGPFMDWNTAQALYEPTSQIAEEGIAEALKAKSVPVRSLAASLRPLNNIALPALALEIAPQSGDIVQLTSPSYQQSVAAAVATGVLNLRDKLKVEPK